MLKKSSDYFVFIVDAKQPAKDWAAELCAYTTGRINDLFEGYTYSSLYEKELKREPLEKVLDVANKTGHSSPWYLVPTPNCYEYEHEIFCQGEENKVILACLRKNVRARTAYIREIQKILSKLEKGETVGEWTRERALQEVEINKQSIVSLRQVKEITVSPALCSCAIFFESKPSQRIINLIEYRASRFSEIKRIVEEDYDSDIGISGFRLLGVRDFLNTLSNIEENKQ